MPAFLLHQAAERYCHAVWLVCTAYKPKLHDLEELAKRTATLHEAMQGALPRAEGEESRLFGWLKRLGPTTGAALDALLLNLSAEVAMSLQV